MANKYAGTQTEKNLREAFSVINQRKIQNDHPLYPDGIWCRPFQ